MFHSPFAEKIATFSKQRFRLHHHARSPSNADTTCMPSSMDFFRALLRSISSPSAPSSTSTFCALPPAGVLPETPPASLAATGEAPPPGIVTDVFCRFGNLIDAYCLRGKKCGYARYASKESAAEALAVLNDVTLVGSRLKVVEADEEKSGKRPRLD